MIKRIAAGDGASLITQFGLYLLLWPQQSQGRCWCKAERLADQFDTQRRRVLSQAIEKGHQPKGGKCRGV